MNMNKIGLIAGSGRFPFLVAEEIKKRGELVAAIGLRDETDPSLEQYVDTFTWAPLGQLQKIIDFLHKENVSTAIMAGKVHHSHLFAGLKLDWRAIKLLGSIVNKKTDSILGAVALELKKESIELLPSHGYLTHLLPDAGIIAGKKLSSGEKSDVDFGKKIAKQIAGLDIGQSVAVKDKAVIAVEAMEGTDECIKRAATLGNENIVLVKVAKPNQDWRFDIPVIGPDTITVLAQCKARVLAVEAGATLMINKDEIIKLAESNNITVIAI